MSVEKLVKLAREKTNPDDNNAQFISVLADKLEELAAENERLRFDEGAYKSTIELLKAENAALREALERIAAPAIFFLSRKDAIEMRNTARTALARNAGGNDGQ